MTAPTSAHVTVPQVGQFCALRAQPCNCPSNEPYIKNARAKAKGWAKFSFQATVTIKGVAKKRKKVPEAHHILCTASVRDFLFNVTKINPIIANCKWCINATINMMPLPLWGHTVKHYHTWVKATKSAVPKVNPPPPLFADFPQHNIGHNGPGEYRSEIDKDIKKLAKGITKSIKPHKANPQSIAGDLDALSTKWDGKLVQRGIRQGGTHAAWTRAMSGKTAKWYEPFSMASTGCIKKKGFPVTFADKTQDVIDKIKNAMW